MLCYLYVLYIAMRYLFYKTVFLIFAILIAQPVWALNLSTNAYGGQSVYIEVQSAQKAVEQLKKFYSQLRGKASAAEFEAWGEKFEQKLGFNIFNPSEFKKVGLSPSHPILFSIRFSKASEGFSQGGVFHIYLPASHSNLLYKTIIDSEKTTEVNEKTGELIEKRKGREIKKGVYKITEKDSNVYILRYKNFVHITNSEVEQAEVVPSSKSLAQDVHYQKAIKNKVAWTPHSILRMVAQGAIYRDISLEVLTKVLGEKTGSFFSSYLEEIEKNLEVSATLLEVNEKRLVANSFSVFEEGYFQKKDSVFSQLVQVPARPLRSDFIDNKPLLYLKLSSQPKLFSLLLDVLKHYQAKSILTYEKENGFKIEQDVLPTLNGSLAVVLDELPPYASLKEFDLWKIFLQLGLNEQGEKQINETIQKLANNNSLQKKSRWGGSLWSSKEKKKDVFFLNKNELTVNPHQDFLKSLKKTSGVSLLSKTIKKHIKEENNYFFYFLFDVEKLNNYFLTEIEENRNGLLSMVYVYTQNIVSLWSYSKIEKNEIVSRFSFNLKQ